MPNRTVRASAQALPKDEIAADRPERDRFDRLYANWLRARTAHMDPDLDLADVAMDSRQDDADEAGRQLLIAPALYDWMVWEKWEVLDFYLDNDAVAGKATDNRTVVALACIKADIMRLGIGSKGDEL